MKELIALCATFIVLSAAAGAQAAAPAPVAKTGQNTSYTSGDDGALQPGIAWPNPRFSDEGDQTITDRLTGLVWSKEANAPGPAACGPGTTKTWQGALDYVKCLNSNNYLGYNDWRLPNRKELFSLLNLQQSDSATWLNTQGFTSVQSFYYWSGSTYALNTTYAWRMSLLEGHTYGGSKALDSYVWPVRSGQYWAFDPLIISAASVFGAFTDGSSAVTRPVEIGNRGASAITITSIAISGTNSADFTVTSGGSAPCVSLSPTLAAGASCTVQVTAAYTTPGVKSANLTITVNSVSHNVPLTSTVIATPPVISSFTMPATITSLNVPISTFVATDNVSVTGYCLRETNSSSGCAWSGTAPNNYTFATGGNKTLYAFAKDAIGNVSTSVNANSDVATKPTITAFTMPVTSNSLTVPITFAATDNVSVTGYCFTEVNDSSACSWNAAAPATYTFASSGSKTLYAFAKDAIGNISTSLSATSDVATAPEISAFIIPATSKALATSITTFIASDNVAVTGYKITETSTPPLVGDTGWSVTVPTTYTFSSSGNKTLYAWAKDAIGNVSAASSAAVLVDITKPIVSTFTLPVHYNNLTIPVSSLSAIDDLGVGAYLITITNTAPLATNINWSVTAPITFTFAPSTASGVYTLYAWAKDNAGNISATSISASITLDFDIPTVTAFSMASYISNLTVPVNTFTAADGYGGVTGYQITESNAMPLSTDSGWSGTAPVSYTFSTSGSKTLYAWAKDAAGNVSAPVIVSFEICSTITASSDANGTITLPGLSTYYCNQNRLYNIAPKPGFRIADVLVDGSSVGKVSHYLFAGMTSAKNHTISVNFEPDPFANWHEVDPGTNHTLAVRADGTLWGWGDNSRYQLGDGTTTTRYQPLRITSYSDWQTAGADFYHSLGLRSNGELYGWGDNSSGQLGAFSSPVTLPVLTDSNLDFSEIYARGVGNSNPALSSYYSLARKSDGSFKLMGVYPTGSSTAATLKDWVAVEPSYLHAAAIRADGTIWGWGDNTYGQLGDGTTTTQITPVQVGSENTWVQVKTGGLHTVGLMHDGTLWSWGDNTYGQLGDGTTTPKKIPVQIGVGSIWIAISSGGVHTLALRQDGTIWAFGLNLNGQLGNGDTVSSLIPVKVGFDNDWKIISAHASMSYGIKNNNAMYAWGANNKGQLGDSTVVDKLSPVLIGTNTDSYVITATSSSGGSIFPFGAITVMAGGNKAFAISPLLGYQVSDVKIDGVSQGTLTTYTFNNVSANHTIQVTTNLTDTAAPTVTVFTMPTTATSLTVPVTTFSANDNTAVTGYILTESSTAPLASASGWTSTAPSAYTFGTAGSKTLYAFAKDAAGNISAPLSAGITVTLSDTTAPTVTAFAIPATSSSLTVPIITFTAADNSAVTGYMLSEVSSAPLLTAQGWSSTATGSYTFGTGGNKTLYAFAKDAAGNVSPPASDSTTITLIPQFMVTPTTGSGYTISPATAQTISNNGTTSFSVTPLSGYGILSVIGCGGSLNGNTFTTAAVTAGCTVTVTAIARTARNGTALPTINDALKVLQAVFGITTLNTTEQIRYDVAPLSAGGTPLGNGNIDSADVIAILRRSIGIGSW